MSCYAAAFSVRLRPPLLSSFDFPAMSFAKTVVVVKPATAVEGFIAGRFWGPRERIVEGAEGSGDEVRCEGVCRVPYDYKPCFPVCTACGAVQPDFRYREAWVAWLTCRLIEVTLYGCDLMALSRLPRCQVHDESGSGTAAYGWGQKLRLTIRFAPCPLQRVGAKLRNCLKPFGTGAWSRSGPLTKRCREVQAMDAPPHASHSSWGACIQTTWHKYRIDKNSRKAPKGEAVPSALRDCIWICKICNRGCL